MKFVLKIFVLSIFLIFPQNISAYYTGMSATNVIGQPNLYSGDSNQGGTPNANTLRNPNGMFFDSRSGKFLVADTGNNRVLIFNRGIPTTDNASADVVIGQANMTSNSANQGGTVAANTLNGPSHVFVTKDGKLLIADSANMRVLIFNQIPTTDNASADVVIGQANMTSNSVNQGGGTGTNSGGPNTLRDPSASVVAEDGRLLIADGNGNHRILIFNQVPTTNNASADVVIGPSNFTQTQSNQGVDRSASTLSTPIDLLIVDNKLLVTDLGNRRVLIFNQIPTEIGASADVVIGQADFTTNTLGAPPFTGHHRPFRLAFDGTRLFLTIDFSRRVYIYHGIPTQNQPPVETILCQPDFSDFTKRGDQPDGCSDPRGILAVGNKLLVTNVDGGHRILIFENILSTPRLDLNKFEAIGDNKIKISGNAHLGEAGKYSIQDVKVSVDGAGGKFVTNIDSNVYDNVTIYDWYHEFMPENYNEYTLKITSSSNNVMNTSLFYFTPFNLNSIANNVVFSVPKNKINLVKDNISHFEIFARLGENSEWSKLGENISTSEIDEHGTVIADVIVLGEVKVVAVSKDSNWRQDSNSLKSSNVGSYINPNNYKVSKSWFPLQINSIKGVTNNILSSFAPTQINSLYKSTTSNPVFKGVAFNNSTVAMRVTDFGDSSKYREYYSTSINSVWSINPVLYNKSVVTISVYDSLGNYNQLIPIIISLI